MVDTPGSILILTCCLADYRCSSLRTLCQVNVVDTPGTNVILGRQQRLTEEYVPRADLVRNCLQPLASPAGPVVSCAYGKVAAGWQGRRAGRRPGAHS